MLLKYNINITLSSYLASEPNFAAFAATKPSPRSTASVKMIIYTHISSMLVSQLLNIKSYPCDMYVHMTHTLEACTSYCLVMMTK